MSPGSSWPAKSIGHRTILFFLYFFVAIRLGTVLRAPEELEAHIETPGRLKRSLRDVLFKFGLFEPRMSISEPTSSLHSV